MDMSPQTLGPIIGVVVALGLVFLRNRAPRPLNVQWMWVMPVLVAVLIGWGIWASTKYTPHAPFTTMTYGALIAALLAGCAVGWWRGKTIRIHRDPATNRLMAQASPIGLIFIFALFAVRYAAKGYLETHASEMHLNLVAVTDGFMLFAAGLLVVSRIEMWLRARSIELHPETAATA